MLKRYDIIDVDDLRRAAERASTYQGKRASVVPLRPGEAACGHGHECVPSRIRRVRNDRVGRRNASPRERPEATPASPGP